MKWLYETKVRHSPVSGDITLLRLLGRWEVSVGGCGQSTSYTDLMWTDAYRRLRKLRRLQPEGSMLMLGLGAGSGIAVAHKEAACNRATAIEYDPTMIALARELELYKPYNAPTVLEGDAAKILSALTEQYDIIVVDLFNGPEPTALITDPKRIIELKARLAPAGTLIINVYKRPEYLRPVTGAFAYASMWEFKDNALGAFWE